METNRKNKNSMNPKMNLKNKKWMKKQMNKKLNKMRTNFSVLSLKYPYKI